MAFKGIVHRAVWKELPHDMHAEARAAMRAVVARSDPTQAADVRTLEGSSYPGAYRLRVGRARILFILLPGQRQVVFMTSFVKKRESDYRAALRRLDARVRAYE